MGRIGKMKTRSAVLHSTLTKETAVIHASTEEEKETISFNIIFFDRYYPPPQLPLFLLLGRARWAIYESFHMLNLLNKYPRYAAGVKFCSFPILYKQLLEVLYYFSSPNLKFGWTGSGFLWLRPGCTRGWYRRWFQEDPDTNTSRSILQYSR